MKDCKICKFFSRAFGRPLMFLLGRNWKKISREEILAQRGILNLEIVGGLKKRGWTSHDIDVIGNKKDVSAFAKRLRKAKINNPVHYCGNAEDHSHILCLWNGLILIVKGIGYY